MVAVGLGLAACSGSEPSIRPPDSTTTTAPLPPLGFSDADNGRSVDVAVGQRLTVILHSSGFVFGDPSDPAVVRGDGTPTVTPGGESCVEGPGSGCGTVVASFVALAPGSAELRADRSTCAEPDCAAADARWRLLVRVGDPSTAPVTTTTLDLGSEVVGTVVYSPTCPVEMVPPDPACEPRPGPAIVELARPDGIVVAQARVGDSGAFVLSVPRGTYTVVVFTPSSVGSGCAADPAEITTELDTSTAVTVNCDTGIR
jgi:hypothetical protein